MTEEKIKPKELSISDTRKEMLDAYNALVRQVREKRESGRK